MTIMDQYPDLDRKLEFSPVTTERPRSLTAEQITHYNEKGYITELDVFSDTEATLVRGYFDVLSQLATLKGYNSYGINGWHTSLQGLFSIVSDSRIADYLEDLLGPNLICWGSHFFTKEPGSEECVAWHQDVSYWPMSESRTVTVWLAIDDVDEANGAMKVIPGSHLHGQIGFDHTDASEKAVLDQVIRNPEDYGDNAVSINLKAGQIELHSDLLIHGSAPNPSSRRRCGLTMRFLPPDIFAYNGWGGNAIAVRGTDPFDQWTLKSRPVGETIPDRS